MPSGILELKVFGMMYYDYNKRSYLLPPGCKDLIDLLRLEEQKKQLPNQWPMLPSMSGFAPSALEFTAWKLNKNTPKKTEAGGTGTPASEVIIPEHGVLVLELAKLTGQKPFKVIADLMEIGIFANVKQKVGFDAAARVLKKYGITAKKAA
jgi:hypothetical protein